MLGVHQPQRKANGEQHERFEVRTLWAAVRLEKAEQTKCSPSTLAPWRTCLHVECQMKSVTMMIGALKLVTNLVKGNMLGAEVKGGIGSSKDRLAEALESLHVGGLCKSGGRRG